MQFGSQSPLVEMPVSWSLDDSLHFEFMASKQITLPGLATASGVLKNWLGDFTYMQAHTDWGILIYTCHPYVIGRGHRMLMLEHLIQALIDKGAIFATMEDAVGEFRGRQQR